jgi:hypothetical protein
VITVRRVTLLFVLLAFTWSGLAAWTYVDHRALRAPGRACRRCDRELTQSSHHDRDP